MRKTTFNQVSAVVIVVLMIAALVFVAQSGEGGVPPTATVEITDVATEDTPTDTPTQRATATETETPTQRATEDDTPTQEILRTQIATDTPEVRNCNRISYNINGFAVHDWEYLQAHLQASNPCVVLMMDDSKRALELAQLLPDAIIVFRQYHPADGSECFVNPPQNQVDEFIRVFTEKNEELGLPDGYFKERIALYGCSNEPSIGSESVLREVLRLEQRFMIYAREKGVTVVSGNWAVGTVTPNYVEDGLFHDYLITLSENQHYMGVHEYTTFFLPFGTGMYQRSCLLRAECVQEDNWVTADMIEPVRWFPVQSAEFDPVFGEEELAYYYYSTSAQSADGFLPPYYHTFRSLWFDIYAVENGIPRPLKIVTEGLHDRLDDIDRVGPNEVKAIETLEQRYGLREYMNDIRGAPSHCRLYTTFYYPDQSCAESIFKQWTWWDAVADSTYLGVTVFTWSQHEHWQPFNVDGTEQIYDGYELHDLLEEYADGLGENDG